MKNNNNNGYEYEVVKDAQGSFIEIYNTDKKGERLSMHLCMFVNSNEGETIEEALAQCETELYDGGELLSTNYNEDDLKIQRDALAWLKEAYTSIQDFKENSWQPLGFNYSTTTMRITTTEEFKKALSLWSPYTKAFVFNDGEVCCERCARDNSELIEDAIEQEDSAPNWWMIVGVDTVEEPTDQRCIQCNKLME